MLIKCENEDLHHFIECKRVDQDNINKLNPEQILEDLYGEEVKKLKLLHLK